MHVEYTDHALERLETRGISKKSVRKALTHGRASIQPDNSIKKEYNVNGRLLVVIYQKTGSGKALIITVYHNGN